MDQMRNIITMITHCVVVSVDEVAVIRKPADAEHYQDDDEHLGQLPLVVHLPPVAHGLLGLLVPPEGGAQVTVGHRETEHGQYIAHQEEDNLGYVIIVKRNNSGCVQRQMYESMLGKD